MKFVYLFITVALVLVSAMAEYDWSGFVNLIKEDFDFVCPDNFAITGVASQFDDAQNDRRWEYQCSSGGGVANVSSSCSLQDPINEYSMEFNFECPNDGYIAGFMSTFSDSEDDRQWYPNCCTRTYSSLVDCDIPSSSWENNVELLLNWTTSSDRVLTGAQSFYSPFNRDRRWRFKQCKLEVNCGDPGVPDNAMRTGDNFLYQDKVTFTCNNGYYQSSGPEGGVRQCLDTGLWSDTEPQCSLCTNIENCADIRCTSATDQYCEECESDQGFGLGERGYVNMNTTCEPVCSWLRSFCYPGECPADYTSCNCTEGFEGLDCLEITAEPDLNLCEIKITSPEELTTECTVYNSTEPIYINFIPSALTATWDTSFMVESFPPEPAYVHSYRIGISQADVVTNVYRMNSYPQNSATNTSTPCSSSQPSSDSPLEMVDCKTNVSGSDLEAHTFLHGDWFKVEILISNGGFLNITDLDSNLTETHYYTSTPILPNSLFVIDTQPPTHCSVVNSQTCFTDQFVLNESLPENSTSLEFLWGGWSDIPSQVAYYTVEVYKLLYNASSDSLYESSFTEFDEVYDSDGSSVYTANMSEPLSSEGSYSIILIISDTAGNEQYARQITVFDQSSELKEDTDIPLVISSGTEEKDINAFWQNSTTDPLIVSGVDHFYNENLRTENWLASVEQHVPPIPPEFDDGDRSGIENARGITSLSYDYIIDQEAGKSEAAQTRPSLFPYQTDDLALEAVEVTPPPVVIDGDSVTIWFEARDYRNNDPVYENVLVHIDSSPPLVKALGLVKTGVPGLISLYGLKNLVDLDVSFEAQDVHSGLDRIMWTLETDSENVGSGNVPVTDYDQESCLLDADCICDVVGHCHKIIHSITFLSSDFNVAEATHDTDYYLTIIVHNHAQLQTTLTEQFTVDLTPPLTGTVVEKDLNKHQANDIDYQQSSLTFVVEWEGFFDRETAIVSYQYIVDTECASASDFEYPNLGNSNATNTTETSITWTADANGTTYYTTVVAFNGAYLASDPVCSDGIIVDMEPPRFTGLNVPRASVQEGIVSINDEVWVIHSNRERSQVESPGSDCISRSLKISVEELEAFPIRCESLNTTCVTSKSCLKYDTFNPRTYTPIDTLLNITWSAIDNIGIKEYQFGVSSAESKILSPDVIEFTSTAGFSHYSAYSPRFITTDEFYVVVKAIDLSMQEVHIWIGPISIDITPPVVNDNLTTTVEDNLIVISWEEWDITDDEDIFPLTYQYSIGRTMYGEDVLPFTALSTAHPNCSGITRCTAIDAKEMGFLKGNKYHVTIKAENTAGLDVFIPIEPSYTMPFTLDSDCFSVYEHGSSLDVGVRTKYSFSNYVSQQHDHDIIINSNGIYIGWYGLTDKHLGTTFSVAIGSLPGLSDIVLFQEAGEKNPLYIPSTLLKYGVTYYSTVKAVSDFSEVTKSSDGFLLVDGSSIDDAGIWNGLTDDFNEEYRLSSTEVAAHWYFPPSISKHVSHYEWAVFRTSNHNAKDLTMILDYESVGTLNWGIRSSEVLNPEFTYVTSVRACFKPGCLQPLYSDEFFIALAPNSSLSIIEAYYWPNNVDEYGYSSSGRLTISWDPFIDPVGIVSYEWAIGSAEDSSELLEDWTTYSSDVFKANITLFKTISLHKVYYVTVRGKNVAGLETSLTTELSFKTHQTVGSIIVYDVSDDVVPDQNEDIEFFNIEYNDLDYTSSSVSLSAIWPDLRYTTYNYSISTVQTFEPCNTVSSLSLLSCGSTRFNGVTVSGLNLTHGQTYYFCVRAEADNVFTPYLSGPKTVTSCSNGIVASLSPPVGGCVQLRPSYYHELLPTLTSEEIGSTNEVSYSEKNTPHHCMNETGFQSSTSELYVIWDPFMDKIESAPHNIQIAYYEYAIGTAPSKQNVVQFTKVGCVNSVRLTRLDLEHGLTYYATIRGTDHTGGQSLVTSLGLTVDVTPPTFKSIWLNTPFSIAAISLDQVVPHWDLPVDKESGLSKLYWSLGSEPGLGDLYRWKDVGITDLTAELDGSFAINDGQPLRVNLLAVNKAGLASISSSQVVVYDSTPPCSGRVFNGPQPKDDVYVDLDYSNEHNSLDAHWEPFWDPHTSIFEYQWAIGTCVGCSDISQYMSSGLLTAIHKVQSLRQGKTYYISVRGCSLYSGCVLSYSDGVTIDVTAPVTRQIIHGLDSSPLIQFQASRNTISGHWSNIHDDESSITHYIYYIGTSPSDDSYVLPTTIPPSQQEILESAPFDNAKNFLPVGETVYITLEVYNGVELSSTVSSGGVVISNVQPVSMETPYVDIHWSGSILPGTQYANSALRINWNFSDPHLMVDRYFWNMVFEEGTYHLIQPQITYESEHDIVLGIELSDGSVVSGVVIGCNQAGLCARSRASNVTIDSSAPIDGYFVLNTNSSAELPWTVEDGMGLVNVISGTVLNLTFTGFSDPHSGILEYWLSVGSSYLARDLYYSSNTSLSNITLHHSNPDVLVATVTLTRNLTEDEQVFITLWAVNGVGLSSKVVQGTFRVNFATDRSNITLGSLDLLRSQLCPIETCAGHCTCSERGHICDSISSCTELDHAVLNDNQKVIVSNVVPQLSIPLDDNEPLFTAISDKLVGSVEYLVSNPDILFLEWSVGEKGKTPGSGVIDTALDPVWFPLVTETNLVFEISNTHPLVLGREYVFYARAWYDSSDYAIFESEGVIFDNKGPSVNEGHRVREVTSLSSTMDIDYSPSLSELTVKWTDVFTDEHSTEYSDYDLCIGTSPRTSNVYPCTDMSGKTFVTLTDLILVDNTQYYTSLKATNKLEVMTVSVSDGFLVDLTPPEVGVVFDGNGQMDEFAHTSSDSSNARVYGFNDPHSGVGNFFTRYQTQYNTDSDYTDKEITRSFEIEHEKLPNGNTTFVSVTARNIAGLSSEAATSTGSIIDSTAPTIVECSNVDSDLIETGSFDVDEDNDECTCSDSGWSIEGEYTLRHIEDLWTSSLTVPHDRCCALELGKESYASQVVESEEGKKHSLSFWVLATNKPMELQVECKGKDSVPVLRERTTLKTLCTHYGHVRWQKLIYTFTANSNETTVSITAPPHYPLIIDNVELQYCQDDSVMSIVDRNNFTIAHDATRPHSIVWPVEDTDSGIDSFLYAIGTVKGGVQISEYKYTGQDNRGFYDLWQVKHSSSVFFSVKATNRAGLSAIFYSDPVTIDETPPVLSNQSSVKEVLTIGGNEEDLDYSNLDYIVVDWSGISDDESGIKHCTWALGSSPGQSDIKNYTVSTESFANVSSLYDLLSHGDAMFATVVCLNNAGYATSATSDGLTLLTTPPTNQSAYLVVQNPALTECPAKMDYVSSDSVLFHWNGFTEPSNAPLYYQMKIVENGESPEDVSWRDMNLLKQVTVDRLSSLAQDIEHTVMVRSYTVEGMFSQIVSQTFTIVSSPPTVDATVQLNVTQENGLLVVQWNEVFASAAPLYYVVSVGTQLGGSSIRKLETTEKNFIEISEQGIKETGVYFISITAVNYAGLSSHSNYMIDSSITVKV